MEGEEGVVVEEGEVVVALQWCYSDLQKKQRNKLNLSANRQENITF